MKSQVPLVQVGEALAGTGHALPHAPQLAMEVLVVVSHPLAGFLSQSPKPGLQVGWQPNCAPPPDELAVQMLVAVPGDGTVHTTPQPPQLALVLMAVSHPCDGLPVQC